MTLLWLLPGQAAAQEQPPAEAEPHPLDSLLEEVRQLADETRAINEEREQEFTDEQEDRAAILAETEAELARQTERSDQLRARFDENELQLETLNDTLRVRTGDMGELFGVFRQMAAEVSGAAGESFLTAEEPGRIGRIAALTASDGVPGIDELRRLQVLLLEEMVESGRVSRFETELSDAEGMKRTAEVVRIGVFNAVSVEGYLQLSEAGLNVLPRQPARRYASQARDFFAARNGNVAVALDPSRGSLLSLVIQSPGTLRQLTYGGAIGYTILTIGLAGLLIALWRLWTLHGIAAKVSRQLGAETVSSDNPLGRILAVASSNDASSVAVLERKLDEAVLREVPLLERYQGIVKVIAGVAPLMGLLGTVVGMIRTFQTITLFGSGDPKLMADGISQALVTTVEGLIVAIPLVFLHAFMTDRSRELIEILEEQSAGIIARHTERAH